MENNFIISTTNNIEGCPIRKYIDTICSNIVIGTNIFSDFAASFTDFFGGRSDSYKRKLEIIYNEAIKELKQKAISVGANAVIGFKVDFDEISGKDKSMFMVSASGTACLIEYKEQLSTELTNNDIITQTALDKEIYRRSVISRINNGESIKEKWVEFLLENPQTEIIDNLIQRYITYYKNYDTYKEDISFIQKYISILPKTYILEKVYSLYETNKQEVKDIITVCNLFNAQQILSLCDRDPHAVINLLSTSSDYYQKADIDVMKLIYEKLTSLPDTGKIETVKGGLLSKEQKKFICQNGHKSSPDAEFCENYNCNLNIKGLTKEEVSLIRQFKYRIDILDEMLSK
ncbi:YbjQ family protein [uncultured Parabacteroides sp.]|uniref:YbjQ family protein n=1 Tax=uncultured Parabacteroides sp. TaxID=512312 RepID=UPI0025D45DDE|nr:YbjQ family protein [uncultured Parabacteroides sp.]